MTTSEWFHLVGLISVFALGIGVVTGAIGLGLSWKINRDQEAKMALMEKAVIDAQTALGMQQERAAIAEKELLALQERMKAGFIKLER